MKKRTGRAIKDGKRLYQFEFPADGAAWYAKKSGTIRAVSRAAARRELVKRLVLEPFEARVVKIVLAKPWNSENQEHLRFHQFAKEAHASSTT